MVKRTRATASNSATDTPPNKIARLLDGEDHVAPLQTVTDDFPPPTGDHAGCESITDADNAAGNPSHANGLDVAPCNESPVHSTDDVSTETAKLNSFSSLFPSTKSVLPGVLAITTSKEIDGPVEAQDIYPIDILQAHPSSTAQRVLNWAAHPDNTTIKSPKGGIVNVSLADPATLFFHEATGYLWSQNTRSWVVSTLLGQTEYYNNEPGKIRQICITPFTQGWYRFTAILAGASGEAALFFQSWMGGVTFGTNRFTSNGLVVSSSGDKNNRAPIDGTILRNGQAIPVFDGRTKFQLGKYWECPYVGDVVKGSTVMVLFTVKKGPLPKASQGAQGMPSDVKAGFYLNVLGVIVLADPSGTPRQSAPCAVPTEAGVHEIKRLPQPDLDVDGPDPLM